MKNNTKLIMETWRRFLNEEGDPESMSGKTPLPGEAPFDEEQPLSGDRHLGSPDDAFDREVQGGGPDGDYVLDAGIIDALRNVLNNNPEATPEDLKREVPEAYDEEIEEALAQHQEESPGTMLDDHEALSRETGGDYSSQDAELERSSLGRSDRDY